MDNKIKTAKKTGDTSDLESQLKDLTENRKSFEKQLSAIQKKYSLIKFKEAVIFPVGFFVLSILFNELSTLDAGQYKKVKKDASLLANFNVLLRVFLIT